MRIFIGFTDIANLTHIYSEGFRALGHETFTVVWNKSVYYPDSEYDLVIEEPAAGFERKKKKLKASQALLSIPDVLKCDVFLLYSPSVLPNHLYLPLIKALGKKVISAFWGSDIRHWYAYGEHMSSLGVADEVRPFIEYSKSSNRMDQFYVGKVRTIRAAERWSDIILSQPGYAQLQTRPYMRANVPFILSEFRFNVPDRIVPLVVHAPSVRGVKGTEFVLEAVEQLKQEGVQFEFRLIEKMPNSDLRELLAEADIVVDELFADTVGMLSTEAMACGAVSLVRYMPELAAVPEGCPAVNVNKDTLKEKLREIILNRDMRRQLAYAGRPYVEKNFDHVKVARQLLGWLQPGGIQAPDFTPIFYRQLAIPPEILKAEQDMRNEKIRRLLFAKKARSS
jgi:hypothetical protein